MVSWHVNALDLGFKSLKFQSNPYRGTSTQFRDVVALLKGFIFASSIRGKSVDVGSGENRICSPKQRSTGRRSG